MQDALIPDPTSKLKNKALDIGICELGRNRFHVHENVETVIMRRARPVQSLQQPPRPAQSPRHRKSLQKPWKLVESIWGPRCKTAASGGFYDTAVVKQRVFARDWEVSCSSFNLAKKISRAAKEIPDVDGADVLEMMRSSMAKFSDAIYQAFNVYVSKGLRQGREDFFVTFVSYLQFIRDLSLIDNDVVGQREQDLHLIFESTNAAATKDDVYNPVKALNRHEWVGALVQIILQRYVIVGKVPLNEAVHDFFVYDLRPNVPDECFQDPNSFRSDYCYLESTDLTLRMYEPSLRAVYATFALGTGDIGNSVFSTKLLDFVEYTKFASRLNLIGTMTMRDLRLAFLWCRMVVIDESTTAGRVKIVQLAFEDFLELLVRLAFMMPLPNDQDIFDLGVAHAGEYLEELERFPDELKQFKQSRGRRVGDKLDQPIAHKVRHFIEWMLHAVRGGSDGVSKATSAMPVTKKEVERFRIGRGMDAKMKAVERGSLDVPASSDEGAIDDGLADILGAEQLIQLRRRLQKEREAREAADLEGELEAEREAEREAKREAEEALEIEKSQARPSQLSANDEARSTMRHQDAFEGALLALEALRDTVTSLDDRAISSLPIPESEPLPDFVLERMAQMAEEEAAATKMQAMKRGKRDRDVAKRKKAARDGVSSASCPASAKEQRRPGSPKAKAEEAKRLKRLKDVKAKAEADVAAEEAAAAKAEEGQE